MGERSHPLPSSESKSRWLCGPRAQPGRKVEMRRQDTGSTTQLAGRGGAGCGLRPPAAPTANRPAPESLCVGVEKGSSGGLNKGQGARDAARTEGDHLASAPGLRGPGSSAEPAGWLQSPRWEEGRSRSQGLGPPSLWAHTAILAGGPGRGRADGAGRRAPGAPRGLAQVFLITLDGLLDAQEHGGEPLVQPGDGVVLLHRLGVAVHVLLLVGF